MEKKYKKILIISLLVILILYLMFLIFDLRLKGTNTMTVSYRDEYIEPGYISLLPVKIKGKVRNDIGVYKLTYKSFLRKRTRTIKVVDSIKPTITLNGGNITLLLNEEYEEPGVKAVDEVDGKLKVDVTSGLNNKKEGVYKITYTAKDKSGNKATEIRQITVVNSLYKEEYEALDNTLKGFSSGNMADGKRPTDERIKELKKYDSYFVGEDTKKVYLTFDEGNIETYLKEIVEVLDKNDIKATFFLCKGYIDRNPELVKSIVDSGHSVGNHTVRHLSMPSLADKNKFSDFISEIKQTEIAFKQATGQPMEKLFRFPMGEYSVRTLTILKDLGYKSYFWSSDYLDWDKEYSKEHALENLKKRVHNGALYLIHPKQKGNYLALEEFINYLKEEGYSFDLVKNIK